MGAVVFVRTGLLCWLRRQLRRPDEGERGVVISVLDRVGDPYPRGEGGGADEGRGSMGSPSPYLFLTAPGSPVRGRDLDLRSLESGQRVWIEAGQLRDFLLCSTFVDQSLAFFRVGDESNTEGARVRRRRLYLYVKIN